jgi:hypothetical protein
MGSVLVVSVTHTRLRVSGSYPSSVCLAKLTRAQRMTRPFQKATNDRFMVNHNLLSSTTQPFYVHSQLPKKQPYSIHSPPGLATMVTIAGPGHGNHT